MNKIATQEKDGGLEHTIEGENAVQNNRPLVVGVELGISTNSPFPFLIKDGYFGKSFQDIIEKIKGCTYNREAEMFTKRLTQEYVPSSVITVYEGGTLIRVNRGDAIDPYITQQMTRNRSPYNSLVLLIKKTQEGGQYKI